VTTTNSNDCPNQSVSGTITVVNYIPIENCIPATFSLGTTGFTSAQTYQRNGITLSEPVTATGCQKTTYRGRDGLGHYLSDCRTNPDYKGDIFSWCMVVQYAGQLCPNGWRVPSTQDFMKYATNSDTANPTTDIKDGVHGWELTGYCCIDETDFIFSGEFGYYWSSSVFERTHEDADSAGITKDNFSPQKSYDRYLGFALRCVK
jgi:uncharacterized protein (TIGR02145 family)